jgi:hypothetical protein
VLFQLRLPVEEPLPVPPARLSLAKVPLLHDVLVLQSHALVVLELVVLLSISLPLLSVVATSTLLDVVVPLVVLVAFVLVPDGPVLVPLVVLVVLVLVHGVALVPLFAFELLLLVHVAGSRKRNRLKSFVLFALVLVGR